jgi:hypothetical protein
MLLQGGGTLKFGVAEPRRESSSLAAMMLLSEALATTDEQLPALVKTLRGLVRTTSAAELLAALGKTAMAGPASEQTVLAHNASAAPVKLVAVQLEPVLAQLDYPFAIRSGISRKVAQAAAAFLAAVLGGSGAQVLAKAAFRAADGTAATGFPDSKATNTEAFVGASVEDPLAVQRTPTLERGNTPSCVRSPSSMSRLRWVPSCPPRARPGGHDGGGGAGWPRPVHCRQPARHVDVRLAAREVRAIGDLTPQRRAEMDQRLANLRLSGSNRAELYETVLAAYRAMLDGYDPNRPNIVVILTDGGDSQPGGLRLEKFSQDLQKLADPTRPIRVVLIGIGVSARDAGDLEAIANVVGGTFFPLTSPEQIQTIFLKALLRVGAA